MLTHIVYYGGPLTDADAKFVADHFDLLIGEAPKQGATLVLPKNYKPSIIILTYRSMWEMHPWYAGWDECELHEDWFLHEVDGVTRLRGKVWESYCMDVGNSGWRQHYANYCKNILEAYPAIDGIFGDGGNTEFPNWVFTVAPEKVPPHPNWHQDMITLIELVKSTISSKLFAINSNDYAGDYLGKCDGQMLEGFIHAPWHTYTGWEDPYVWLTRWNTLGKLNKAVLAESGVRFDVTQEKRMREIGIYCLACAHLTDGLKLSFGFTLQPDYSNIQRSHFPEMDFDFGVPVESTVILATDVFKRTFTKAVICVNMSPTSAYTFTHQSKNYVIQPRSSLIIDLAPPMPMKFKKQDFSMLDWIDYDAKIPMTDEWYAANMDVWNGHFNDLAEAQRIKQINPQLTTMLYRNVRAVWKPGHPEYNIDPYYANKDTLQFMIDHGFLLKDAQGRYIGCEGGVGDLTNPDNRSAYMLDFGNPDFQTHIAGWYKAYMDYYGVDEVCIDNCTIAGEAFYGATATPINPRTGKVWMAREVTDAWIGMIAKIKQTVAPKRVFGNMGNLYTGNHFYRSDLYTENLYFLQNSNIDGIMSEGWLDDRTQSRWYDEAKWIQDMQMAVDMENLFVSQKGKFFCMVAELAGHGRTYTGNYGEYTLPPGVTKEQYALFCYASMLLHARADGEYYVGFGTYVTSSFVQNLFKINLGNPLGSAIKDADGNYVRDFANGRVKVNPTSITRGNLAPHTAEIASTVKHTLAYQSTPIAVPLTVDGQQLLSGQSTQIEEGKTVTIKVPSEVIV